MPTTRTRALAWGAVAAREAIELLPEFERWGRAGTLRGFCEADASSKEPHMLRILRGALEPSEFGAIGDHPALMATLTADPTPNWRAMTRQTPATRARCCITNGGGFIANRTIGA
jgi:hypothetical protein